MLNMQLKHTAVLIFVLFIFCTIGCEQLPNQMMEPNDTVSVSIDDVEPIDKPYTGAVVIGNMDKNYGNDQFVLNSAIIEDDTLTVSVSYSGGCEDHKFTLVASDSFLESFPVQIHVSLAHNANGDTCEAYPTEEYQFDLTPIKTIYQAAYQQDAGTIIIRLKDNPNGELVYKF